MAASLSAALLAGDPAARRLLADGFRDPAARRAHAIAAAARTVSPSLIEVLSAQSEALPHAADRRPLLDALARPGTVAVVTGQQVGLFLGPLYTLHKAATAIALARRIEREQGVPSVALFWLQTEDHDFEEVRIARELGAAGVRAIELPPKAERSSVAHHLLDGSAATAVNTLEAALAGLPHAAAVSSLVREAYAPGRALAGAFARLLAELFRGEGLLLLDPREASVAQLAAPVYRRALVESDAISDELLARGEAIRAAGFEEQVPPRPGAPLLFFHRGNAEGPRHRLERSGEGALLAGGERLTTDELLAILARDPLRFSTSALLRPIVQDALLPTAAYVGGPAEVSYFAQLAPLYARFGLPLPLVQPRARFRLVDGRSRTLLARLGLAPADVERPREELLGRLAPVDPSSPDGLGDRLLGPLVAELDRFAAAQARPDHGLLRALRRTRETVARATARLEARARRASLERDRVLCDRLDRLRDALAPDGAPQERVLGFAGFAARSGIQSLVKQLIAAVDVERPEPRDLSIGDGGGDGGAG